MRTVIYARYSSDQQRTTSIDDQIRLRGRVGAGKSGGGNPPRAGAPLAS